MAEQEKKGGKPAAGKGAVSDDDLEKVSGGTGNPNPDTTDRYVDVEAPPGVGPQPAALS